MKRITGTLRVDATLDDLPGQPVVSVAVVRDVKVTKGLMLGYAAFTLCWPDGAGWHELGQHTMSDTAHLEACVLAAAKLAYEQGLMSAVADRCTIASVWRWVNYP